MDRDGLDERVPIVERDDLFSIDRIPFASGGNEKVTLVVWGIARVQSNLCHVPFFELWDHLLFVLLYIVDSIPDGNERHFEGVAHIDHVGYFTWVTLVHNDNGRHGGNEMDRLHDKVIDSITGHLV